MIKANELRIGNWVNFSGDPMIIRLGEQLDYYTDYYEPIPLTPEILEAAGFDGRKDVRYFKSIGDTVLTIYYEDQKFWIQDFDWFKLDLPSMEYVHQLQNLYFALTGNELEIKF